MQTSSLLHSSTLLLVRRKFPSWIVSIYRTGKRTEMFNENKAAQANQGTHLSFCWKSHSRTHQSSLKILGALQKTTASFSYVTSQKQMHPFQLCHPLRHWKWILKQFVTLQSQREWNLARLQRIQVMLCYSQIVYCCIQIGLQ